jgi:hypothetical protein
VVSVAIVEQHRTVGTGRRQPNAQRDVPTSRNSRLDPAEHLALIYEDVVVPKEIPIVGGIYLELEETVAVLESHDIHDKGWPGFRYPAPAFGLTQIG